MEQQNLSAINTTNSSEILFDLKTIMGDYYVAKLDLNGEFLNLKFASGQEFIITVREYKSKIID